MSRPSSQQKNPYDSLGLSAPKRTFLTSTSGGTPRAGSAHKSRPTTANTTTSANTNMNMNQPQDGMMSSSGGPLHQQNSIMTSLAAQSENEALSTALDTKGVILAEHKVELHDMLEESIALLRNVYRSKHVLGDNLKYADPCYTTDFVGQFNLATPPVFDPSYASTTENAATTSATQSSNINKRPGTGESSRPGTDSRGAGGGGNNDNAEMASELQGLREKLRTAEELVKKLYRRNTQLETENQFVKSELMKLEKLHGLARSKQSSLTVIDGHVPNDHPSYTKRMRRNCRSVPPQRTLMRTAVNGFGLTFPKRASAMGGTSGSGGGGHHHHDGASATSLAPQDPPAVTQLKRRVLQLSEALVAVQHDNEVLLTERSQRNVLRDRLLHRYLVERDTSIAQLHAMLQELLAKVSNPMRLLRTKQQPSLNMNPVVAAQNILRDAASRLSDQVQLLSHDIMKKAGAALPAASSATMNSPTGGMSSALTTTNNNMTGGVGDDNENAAGGGGGGGDDIISANRRRELASRIQTMCDSLPLAKRKNFLNMMVELRSLFTSLANSNHALLATFEEERDVHHTSVVKLKMQVAVLKDQLRSMGVREDEIASVDHLATTTTMTSSSS